MDLKLLTDIQISRMVRGLSWEILDIYTKSSF